MHYMSERENQIWKLLVAQFDIVTDETLAKKVLEAEQRQPEYQRKARISDLVTSGMNCHEAEKVADNA